LGIPPPALELLLDDTTEELLDDLIEELLEETILLLDEERILEELSELAELDTPQLPTTPKGEGWEAQVAVEIQLLLFS